MKNIGVEKLTPEQKIQLLKRLTEDNISENVDGYLGYLVYVANIGFYCITFNDRQADIVEADEESAFRSVVCSSLDIDIELIKAVAYAYMGIIINPSIDGKADSLFLKDIVSDDAVRNVICSYYNIDIELVKIAVDADADAELVKIAADAHIGLELLKAARYQYMDVDLVISAAEAYMDIIINPSIAEVGFSVFDEYPLSQDAKTYLLELHNNAI